MKRRNIFLIGVILVVASVALVAFMVQPTASELLTQSLETMETITDGHAVFAVEADLPENEMSGTAEVWGKLGVGPNGEPAFRVELLESSLPEAEGITLVADGTQFWLWRPAENSVLTGTAEDLAAMAAEKMDGYEGDHEWDGSEHEEIDVPETPEEMIDKLLEYFDAERTGREELDGSPVYTLRLIPIPEQMPEEFRAAGGLFNVWLRATDRAPVLVEYTGGAAGSARATATSLALNEGIDDAVFTFEIPEGAEVVNVKDLEPASLSPEEAAAAAEFDLMMPATLPDEATLLEVLEVRGAMVQRYSLPDGRSFSVAQGPLGAAVAPAGETAESVTVRGLDAQLYTDDEAGRTLLAWVDGDVGFWIGGDLTPEQALTMAESLQ